MARFDGGWVKIYRKAILGDIGSSFLRLGLFQALVGFANLQTSTVSWNGKPRKLTRGELVTSLKELADLGECDRKTVLKHLEYLRLRETIEYEKSYGGVIVKIKNFDKYQGQDAEGSQLTPNSLPFASQLAPISVPHIEERKNKRKKESSHELWPLYLRLVDEYPIKVSASPTGFKRFLEYVKSPDDFPKVLDHLANYKTHLSKNPWKAAKQSIATWFGSPRSEIYWLQWDSPDAGDSKLKKAAGEIQFTVPE